MTNLFNYESQQPTKLVKKDLKTPEWVLFDYLKKHALGKENAIKGKILMEQLGLNSTAEVRKTIKGLRTSVEINARISSCNNGYYIPYEEEFLDGVGLLLNKTLSMIETVVNQFPASASILHKAVGYHYKKTDKANHNQAQIKFTGHEEEFINRYAKKYEGSK